MGRRLACIILVFCSALCGVMAGDQAGVHPDHVVVAVRDLAAAQLTYERLGFSVWPGRRHSNTIANAFVKLMDGTELELLSAAQPVDVQAARYVAFLEGGDGGAFLALAAGPVGEVARLAYRYGLKSRVQAGRAFDLLSFPDEPGLQHVFFIEYHHRPEIPPAARVHVNGAAALQEVWLEGGTDLKRLLLAVGGRPGDPREGPDELSGEAFLLEDVAIVVVPPAGESVRHRILGVSLRTRARIRKERLLTAADAHGIWIRLRPPPAGPPESER
jgi:hypothetical protein